MSAPTGRQLPTSSSPTWSETATASMDLVISYRHSTEIAFLLENRPILMLTILKYYLIVVLVVVCSTRTQCIQFN